MTSGATFRKCDFQIHTPRDPNWSGTRPGGLGDLLPSSQQASKNDIYLARREWARKFVDTCLDRGLRAIAITDHHEMIMIPYVLTEISDRRQEDQSIDLWLFPGMELTLAEGAQCLILFDSDLPMEWWLNIQGALGIPHAAQQPLNSCAPAAVAQLAFGYEEIPEKLEAITEIQGRYIVLPNMSQGGQHTVLRDAWHPRFKRMPYVGGYLDAGQTIASLGAKNRRRISGRDKNWGDRSIYPLPTSDSREDKFAALGSNHTWIKLAEPTAEAIRQAFLAHESRIRLAPPTYASARITKFSLRGAYPMADMDLGLNPELNSVIGGRGSGKSTLLEYLAFGLARSCTDLPEKDVSGSERLRALIQDTLLERHGEVHLDFIQDEAEFRLSRTFAGGYQPQLTYPGDAVDQLSPAELRALIPAAVYCQGELSEFGSTDDPRSALNQIVRLVEPAFQRQAEERATQLETSKSELIRALNGLLRLWHLQAERNRTDKRSKAQAARIAALEKTLPSLAPEDEEELTLAGSYEEAHQHVSNVVALLAELPNSLKVVEDIVEDVNADSIPNIQPALGAYDLIFQRR
jgi:chromosome segregation protein